MDSTETVLIHHDRHVNEEDAPYLLDAADEADDWVVMAATATPAQLSDWRAALAEYERVQTEMKAAWNTAREAAEAREAEEEAQARAEDAREAAIAKAESDAREAVLDDEYGPREWGVTEQTRRDKRHNHFTTRRVHKITCPSFVQVAREYNGGTKAIDGSQPSSALRRPDAIAELRGKRNPRYSVGSIENVACQRCAPELEREARVQARTEVQELDA